MTIKKLIPIAFSACMLAGVSVCALAQSAVDGAIGGNVEDKTGAVIPKATVTIHANGTNAEQKVVTDDSGFFRVIHLTPGMYTITVEAAGFEKFNASSVAVEVGLLTDPHARLTLGSATETVQVSSEAPSINTTSNDFANVVDQKVLEDLPVNNYRWSAYALLTPGVVADSSGFGLLSFRGQSTLLNNVTFDGADDNQAFFSEERGRTRVGYSTAKASIQEFQVNTSNYSVEYGRSAGGVVNAVTKSGGNTIHGEAYFFDRDAEWGAKNPFTTHAVQVSSAPITFQSQVFKPKDWRKQTGIGIGGPIIKDKLFFFFAFDKFLRNFPGVSAPSSPALFYAVPDAAANGTVTGAACSGLTTATVDGAVCTLASNLFKTTVAAVTPAQYTSALATYTNGIAGLSGITGLTPRVGDQDIFFPKIDWQINGKNHATVEMNRLRWTSPAGIQTSTSALAYGVSSFGNDFVKDTFLIGKLDTQITPRLSNEIRYQYGRDFEYENPQTPTSYENTTLDNVASTSPLGAYTNPYQIPPNVSITNAFQFGTATFLNRPAYPDERRYQIADTANLVRGNHNLKFGLDFLHTNDLSENLVSQYGGYTYGGSNYAPFVEYITDLNALNGCGTTHNVECYTGYAQGFGPLGFELQTKDYAAFAQDEWKVNPRLSLTLGVRYEYEQLPNPQIPNTTESTLPFVNGTTTQFPSNKSNFGPRVGFAWDIYGTGRTVLRGGVGEFFARVLNSTIYNAIAQTGNPLGQLSVSVTGSATAIAGTVSGNPYSVNLTFPQIANPNLKPAGATAVYYFDKNFKLPEVQQADLTLDQDLGWNTTLSVTWLAAFGRRLPDFVDTNLPAPSDSVTYTFGPGGPAAAGTTITIPYYKKLTTTANGRPNAAYGSTTDIFSGVNSNYEAVVFQISHKVTKGLMFSGNYTFSHALDYGENNTTFTSTNLLLDPHNLRADYGNSNQNVPNRLVMYAVYNTPSTFKGAWGYLLNNYEISPSFSGQSGLPYSAGVSGTFTPFLTSGVQATGTTGAASSSGGINGTGGAARVPSIDRNIYKYKRDILLDLRVSKRFKIMDKYDVELLGETFNLANHLNVTGVGSTTAYSGVAGSNTLTANSTFGVFNPATFTGSANSNFIYSPRQVQLGVRVQF